MDGDCGGSLCWAKLRSMHMFWPACVYKSYSDAVAHTHDVWALRGAKPALDKEDRVLYFFGVGPRACHVAATGSAPNLQLCVVHEDDLTLEDWTAKDDFQELCARHQVQQDAVTRAQRNACFLRACDEAETYAETVRSDEQAGELFVTLLTMAKKAHKTGKAEVAREIIPSPVKAAPVQKKNQQKQAENKAPDVYKLLKAPAMTNMVAKCWQQMLEAGWETMTQGDGQVLYKMPGTGFFDLVPNVNLFDSLEKACARYLSDWVKSTAIETSNNAEFSELTEFVWPMAAGSGWESMTTGVETIYKRADTPFDQWVPNVTIFSSKTQAVTKYLKECGLIGSDSERPPEQPQASNAVSQVADSDVEMEEPEQSEAESEQELSQAVDEASDASEESVEEEDVEEDNQEEEQVAVAKKAPAKKTVAKTTAAKKAAPKAEPTKSTTKKPTKQAKPAPKQPKQNIPPFKMTFGILERELRNRGWYWKNGGLQWNYYQPYCKTKDKKSLQPDKDYFRGREELEAYLERSGEYDHIRGKLKEEHARSYMLESESEEDDESEVDEVKAVRPKKPAPKPQPIKMTARSARMRSENRFRRGRSKSVARGGRGGGLSSQTTLSEVKFGEIWRVLAEDGWHYLPSPLEYDYFKPHCATSKDGVAGKDYFQSKALLIEHLQTSGTWDRTAARVRAEAALDSSDEDIADSDVETATPVQKRKRDENTPAAQHGSKKFKEVSVFRTPTVYKRSAGDFSDEDEEMDETISPAATGSKGKENHGNSRPLRNLANSFTPSPSAARKDKELQNDGDIAMEPAKEDTPRGMILSAIQKLTSAYIPAKFRYREKEFTEIREFFSDCFLEKEKSSMYISGAPGCGKTALLKATQPEIDELYRVSCGVEADYSADSSS
jgi:hypothetical protein